MISKSFRNMIQKGASSNSRLLVATQQRGMGGGPKKPNMPASETNFDVLFVGGINATALAKFVQHDDPTWKMALVSEKGKFVLPTAYFGVSHGHIVKLKLESGTVSSQVEPWSRTDVGAKITKYLPHENKVVLSNGREYTYKAMVLAPGLDHRNDLIEGLPELEKTPEEENVFVHMMDTKERVERNYYHGWHHPHGDMICYSPKAPYKGEGTDFWALYYESFLRQDKLHGRASANARIQYWTPNKEIYRFPYANEVALDECDKRGIDVMFGWEMVKVHKNEINQKIATFRNVDTGEVIEKDFSHANINPTSQPHQELVDAGITDASGMVDVNPYTLQHERFENIFAFGDCIKGETTRTFHAAVAQCPVVKHNLTNFMDGKELNGVYDGYSYMPFYLSHSNASNFQHLWDYEPAPNNHWVPQYGLFSKWYFGNQMKGNLKVGEKYTSFKKTHGPPHEHFNKRFDPLEHNEYLQEKGVDVEALRSIHGVKEISQA